jgi:hypothetical protein
MNNEALRLADTLERMSLSTRWDKEAATELRRLHEENEMLKKCLFQMQNAAIELAKPEQDVYTKQQNVDTSGQCTHKSDKSIHKPVAYWNTKDNFICADDAKYISNWSDYYPEPLYAAPLRKEWVGLTDDEICDVADYDVMVFARAIVAKLKEKNETP